MPYKMKTNRGIENEICICVEFGNKEGKTNKELDGTYEARIHKKAIVDYFL